jgi:hypothetical protein
MIDRWRLSFSRFLKTPPPKAGYRLGVFEIALPFRGDAFRVIYAVQIADDIRGHSCIQEKVYARYKDITEGY